MRVLSGGLMKTARVLNDTRGFSVWIGDSTGDTGFKTEWCQRKKVAVNRANNVIDYLDWRVEYERNED